MRYKKSNKSRAGVGDEYRLNSFTVGDRIRGYREIRKKQYRKNPEENAIYSCCTSQEKFAKKLGCNRRTINRLESGKILPSIEQAYAICRVLDISFNDLVSEKENEEAGFIDWFSKQTRLKKDILYHLLKDDINYSRYVNFFMDPKRKYLYERINNVSMAFWLDHTEIIGIKEPLMSRICDAYHRGLMISGYCNEEEQKRFFGSELRYYLPKKDVSFTLSKKDTKFHVRLYIEDKYETRKIDTSDYDKLIESLVEYCFEPLRNKMLLELEEQTIAREFLKLYEEYVRM